MWFIGVEVEQETSAPPPKKNPGSAPENHKLYSFKVLKDIILCCILTRNSGFNKFLVSK